MPRAVPRIQRLDNLLVVHIVVARHTVGPALRVACFVPRWGSVSRTVNRDVQLLLHYCRIAARRPVVNVFVYRQDLPPSRLPPPSEEGGLAIRKRSPTRCGS